MFVVLPPLSSDGCVIFGKNSDRPNTEVQEVVYYPPKDHDDGARVQCTYIEIDQVGRTHAVILTKPAWAWGAESGANEHGLCIGRSCVWTKLNGPDDLTEKLFGADLVRLGLERSNTAQEAVTNMTTLLEKHGQGGPGSEEPGLTTWSHHNVFLLADTKEAWVLDTVGTHWAAERITDGIKYVSNDLSVHTKIDMSSPNLIEKAKEKELYKDDDGEFDFARVFGLPTSDNEQSCGAVSVSLLEKQEHQGLTHLEALIANNISVGAKQMIDVLCKAESVACTTRSAFMAGSSQVSAISPSELPSCHWFTGTPNPCISFFKPFIFTPHVKTGKAAVSPDFGADDPARVIPRFRKQVNRKHPLYSAQEHFREILDLEDSMGQMVLENIQELQEKCLEDIDEILKNFEERSFGKVSEIFDHMCTIEIMFYK